MIDCPSRKIIYYSEKEAKEFLIMLHVKYQNSSTRTFYTCDQCGYFHLTFLGEIDDTLKQAEQVGRIDQLREADYWIRKLH
jgi:hypothetical protein